MIEVELFRCPVSTPYIITQTYKEHLEYAAAHPKIVYNGGIDLFSDDVTIRAAFDGTCEKVAYEAGGYGNYIKLKHAWGYSLYAHLERVCINVGDKTPAGMKIGEMGSTGFSTGRHLHFEIRDLTNVVKDPSEFFEQIPVNAHSPLTVLSAPAGGNLRKTPMGDFLIRIPCGTVGRIIDGPVFRYGLACYEVEFPVRGWMADADQYGTKILQDYGE
ncbi:MAG: M23 family metallopeptidase [Flexilinea sp.]|nr:M23 family metallopeptidase [Flexilinea sp.]